jgi:phosphoribosylanthranilate isomerase
VSRTRVKFCGMTRVEDAMMAAAMGVDAIGLVFTARSRRFLAIDRARAIRAAMPPFVDVVALFMDDDAAWVEEVVAQVRPDFLQFHGSEPAEACRAFDTPYFKAIAMGDTAAPARDLDDYADAAALLLDGHVPGEGGGSGQTFDWTRVPSGHKQPLVLAGGLHAENVGEAIARVRPWAVDVSSGIEAAPGIKDPAAMRAFLDAVRAADRHPTD